MTRPTTKQVRTALEAAGFHSADIRRHKNMFGHRDEACTRAGYRVKITNWTRVIEVRFVQMSIPALFPVTPVDIDACRDAVTVLLPFGLRYGDEGVLYVGPEHKPKDWVEWLPQRQEMWDRIVSDTMHPDCGHWSKDTSAEIRARLTGHLNDSIREALDTATNLGT